MSTWATWLEVLAEDPEPLRRDGHCALCNDPTAGRYCTHCLEITTGWDDDPDPDDTEEVEF